MQKKGKKESTGQLFFTESQGEDVLNIKERKKRRWGHSRAYRIRILHPLGKGHQQSVEARKTEMLVGQRRR